MGQTGDESRLTCLWPGLRRLWYDGDTASLAVAITFAALLNGALWATFVRYDTVSATWRLGAWASLATFWVLGLWQSGRGREAATEGAGSQNHQDLFIRAQSQYLRGHWVEAQMLLEELVRQDPADVEARLLLASVYRRVRRIDLSRRELCQVQDCPGAARWRFEIGRELALLDEPSAVGTSAAQG